MGEYTQTTASAGTYNPYRSYNDMGGQPLRSSNFDIGVDNIESQPRRQKLTIKQPNTPKESFSEKMKRNAEEYLRSMGNAGERSKVAPVENWEVNFMEDYKKEYSLDECVDIFLELEKKCIGDIYISGSVGLALQGKLNRTMFKDLDITLFGELELDDDILDDNRGSYPKDPQCKERRPVRFNGMPIDIFILENEVSSVEVQYKENVLKCQDYKKIIQAKLNMALESFKDREYLFNNVIDITIK